jgi:hypothetical protein
MLTHRKPKCHCQVLTKENFDDIGAQLEHKNMLNVVTHTENMVLGIYINTPTNSVRNNVCTSRLTHTVTVQNFEVISEIFNTGIVLMEICTEMDH